MFFFVSIVPHPPCFFVRHPRDFKPANYLPKGKLAYKLVHDGLPAGLLAGLLAGILAGLLAGWPTLCYFSFQLSPPSPPRFYVRHPQGFKPTNHLPKGKLAYKLVHDGLPVGFLSGLLAGLFAGLLAGWPTFCYFSFQLSPPRPPRFYVRHPQDFKPTNHLPKGKLAYKLVHDGLLVGSLDGLLAGILAGLPTGLLAGWPTFCYFSFQLFPPPYPQGFKPTNHLAKVTLVCIVGTPV